MIRESASVLGYTYITCLVRLLSVRVETLVIPEHGVALKFFVSVVVSFSVVEGPISLGIRPLKMGPLRCLETSITNLPVTRCKNTSILVAVTDVGHYY